MLQQSRPPPGMDRGSQHPPDHHHVPGRGHQAGAHVRGRCVLRSVLPAVLGRPRGRPGVSGPLRCSPPAPWEATPRPCRASLSPQERPWDGVPTRGSLRVPSGRPAPPWAGVDGEALQSPLRDRVHTWSRSLGRHAAGAWERRPEQAPCGLGPGLQPQPLQLRRARGQRLRQHRHMVLSCRLAPTGTRGGFPPPAAPAAASNPAAHAAQNSGSKLCAAAVPEPMRPPQARLFLIHDFGLWFTASLGGVGGPSFCKILRKIFYFVKKIYLRKRESESTSTREGQREEQAARSREPDAGLDPRTPGSPP